MNKTDTAFGMVFLLGKFLLARCIASHINSYRKWSVASAQTVRHVAFSRIIPKKLIMDGFLPYGINLTSDCISYSSLQKGIYFRPKCLSVRKSGRTVLQKLYMPMIKKMPVAELLKRKWCSGMHGKYIDR